MCIRDSNNIINFLELSITKLEHRHKFSIYRKPTTTDKLIHNSSNHPIQRKLAAFRTMIHRPVSYTHLDVYKRQVQS